MNILYIDHYAGSPEMGMEFRPYYLSEEWIKMGHSVRILAADYSHLRLKNPDVKKDFQEEMIDGITYDWIKTGTYEGNGVARALTMFRFVRKIREKARWIAKNWKPDVVITSSTYPLDIYAGQKIKKYSKAVLIHEVHDMWPATLYEVGGMSRRNPFVVVMQIAENYAYKNCDELVALAPYSKEYMVRHGLKPYKFHNIQNGIVEQEWSSDIKVPEEHKKFFEEHEKKFIVGYFGGHALSNALDNVLDAAKLCKDPEVAFVLVGKGVEKQRLMDRKNRENIDNVFFLDQVEKKAVPDLVSYFDCSIMTGVPSPLYRFGLCVNKMYDSMMAGIPIICAISAPKTLVEEYDCGIQISDVTAENIISAVYALKNTPKEDRIKMGNRGKQAVLDRFTYKKLAEDFSKLF